MTNMERSNNWEEEEDDEKEEESFKLTSLSCCSPSDGNERTVMMTDDDRVRDAALGLADCQTAGKEDADAVSVHAGVNRFYGLIAA